LKRGGISEALHVHVRVDVANMFGSKFIQQYYWPKMPSFGRRSTRAFGLDRNWHVPIVFSDQRFGTGTPEWGQADRVVGVWTLGVHTVWSLGVHAWTLGVHAWTLGVHAVWMRESSLAHHHRHHDGRAQ
jgi:hypothetical protein